MSQNQQEMYKFYHLPRYAAYLLEHHIDEYTKEQVRLSIELDLPLLKHLKYLSEDEFISFAKSGAVEFLTNVSLDNIYEHIDKSLQRWSSNQLPLIDKLSLEAKDIILINHVRSMALKKWLAVYTSDVGLLLKISSEIDDLVLIYNTFSTNAYIDILKENIEETSHFSSNIIKASPGVTFIFDLIGRKEIYVTGKVEEVIGHKAEDVMKMSNLITQLTIAEDLPVVEDFLKKISEDIDGKTYQAEYRFESLNGKFNWVRCYASVYKRDALQKPVQIIGVIFGISNEKEIAGALLKREKQLLEAQAIGQIGSYEWDIVNDKSESTPELRKIFEADKRQTVEELLVNVHPDDKEKLKDSLVQAFKNGIYKCEYRFLTKKGEKVIDSKGVVAFDNDGKPLTLTGTIQDITERKRIEDQLFMKTLELERSNIHLQEFAYVASHDLKEPLRKISIFSNIIINSEWDLLSERGKANFQKIIAAVKRMQQLIEGILSYSYLSSEAGKEIFSLQDALNEALNNLEFKIKESGAVITFEELPAIKAIPFQIEQLFQNLIGNSLKFANKNVKLVIEIRCEIINSDPEKNNKNGQKKSVKIDIIDNGIGFDKQGSAKIFGLFQRLHARTEYEGSGLGLAICKKIVENHGGSITASSTPGQGAKFTVVLPM